MKPYRDYYERVAKMMGQDAFRIGLLAEHNPFNENDSQGCYFYLAWRDGWHSASENTNKKKDLLYNNMIEEMQRNRPSYSVEDVDSYLGG